MRWELSHPSVAQRAGHLEDLRREAARSRLAAGERQVSRGRHGRRRRPAGTSAPQYRLNWLTDLLRFLRPPVGSATDE